MDEDSLYTFRRMVRMYLKRARLTQEGLARHIGIDKNTLSNILSGQTPQPRQTTLEDIIAGLEQMRAATPQESADLRSSIDAARQQGSRRDTSPPPSAPAEATPEIAQVTSGKTHLITHLGGLTIARTHVGQVTITVPPRRGRGMLLLPLGAGMLFLVLLAAMLGIGGKLPWQTVISPFGCGTMPVTEDDTTAVTAELADALPTTTGCTAAPGGIRMHFLADSAQPAVRASEVDVARIGGQGYSQQERRIAAQFQFAQPASMAMSAGFLLLTPSSPTTYGGYLVLLNPGTQTWQVLLLDSHANHTQVAEGTFPSGTAGSAPIMLAVTLHAQSLSLALNGTTVLAALPEDASVRIPMDRVFGLFVDCLSGEQSPAVTVSHLTYMPFGS